MVPGPDAAGRSSASCCGEADAYWADEIHVRDGKTYATITDDRPDEARGRPHIDVGTEIENPEPQAQMGSIESDRSWHRVPEPQQIRVLLRPTRRRLTGQSIKATCRGSSGNLPVEPWQAPFSRMQPARLSPFEA